MLARLKAAQKLTQMAQCVVKTVWPWLKLLDSWLKRMKTFSMMQVPKVNSYGQETEILSSYSLESKT